MLYITLTTALVEIPYKTYIMRTKCYFKLSILAAYHQQKKHELANIQLVLTAKK